MARPCTALGTALARISAFGLLCAPCGLLAQAEADVGEAAICLGDLVAGGGGAEYLCDGFLGAAVGVAAPPTEMARISEGPGRTQAIVGDSLNPDISADGRYVVYESTARNLVVGVETNRSQIYLYDRATGATTLVSRDEAGEPGDEGSFDALISGDGRWILFRSEAVLLAEDTNGANDDLYLYDRATGTLALFSVDENGTQYPGGSICLGGSYAAISDDGGTVAFGICEPAGAVLPISLVIVDRDGPAPLYTYVDEDEEMAPFNTLVGNIDMTADGRVLVFGLGVGASSRLLLLNRDAAQMLTVVDVTRGRSPVGNVISADGTAVAMQLNPAVGLSPKSIYLWSRFGDVAFLISRETDDEAAVGGEPAISANGRYVAYQSPNESIVPGDMNQQMDIIVYDHNVGASSIASVNAQGQPTENADNPAPRRGDSFSAAMDAAGDFLAFASSATNLEPGDTNFRTDIFVGPARP